jgi:hypothetical protein
MKKFAALILTFGLVSCGGYENLSTPFNFRGDGVNLFGSNNKATGESNQFEVVVNAPAGTPELTAQNLFNQEANKVCGGRPYTKQITSTGETQIRQFGVKGLDTQNNIPSTTLRGIVSCQG